MANLAHTVAEFAAAVAIGAASAVSGVAVSVTGLIFQISERNQQDALKVIQADHRDHSIAIVSDYWARKGLSTPDQNRAKLREFVDKFGGTGWIAYWPHEGAILLWHYRKDFAPVRGSALTIKSVTRGSKDGNEWATNP